MAAIAGYGGQVRIASTAVADVTKWSMDAEADMLDTTALNPTAGAKTYVPGLIGASGTVEANFNMSDTTGQVALQTAFFSRTVVALALDTATSGTNRTYSGSAYISKISPGVEVAGLVTMTFEFTFTGQVSFS